MDDEATRVKRTVDRMAKNKDNFASQYDEIMYWLMPEGEQIFSTRTPGSSNRSHIVDSTGEMAVDNYVAGVMGLATNPAARWFELEAQDLELRHDYEVQAYLDNASDIMFATMDTQRTSFYKELAEAIRHYGVLGTGVLYQGEVRNGPPPVLCRDLAEVELEDDEEGRLKRVGRRFELSYEDAFRIYGAGAAKDAEAKAQHATDRDKTMQFVQLVEPRLEGVGRVGVRGKPWAELTVNLDDSMLVRESGFDELPWHVGRDERRSCEVWGRGRGWKAVPEVRQLQEIEKAGLRGLQKVIDPPLVVEHDALLSPVSTDIEAVINVRRYSTSRGGRPVQSLDMTARPDVAEEALELRRGRIKDIFFSFLLDLLRDPRATATQMLMLDDEQRRKIGPHMVGLFAYLLSPMIGRRFNVLRRARLFGPVPAVLRGRPIGVRYISPLARALQQQDATAFERTVAVLGPLAQIDPTIFDIIDLEAGARGVAEATGLPKRWLRSPRRIDEMRQARNQAAEQQQQVENLTKVAGAVGAAGPLLQQEAAGGGAG